MEEVGHVIKTPTHPHTHLWGLTQIVLFCFFPQEATSVNVFSIHLDLCDLLFRRKKNKVIPNNLLIHTLSPWQLSFYHFGLTEAFNGGRPEKEVAQQGFKEASCCSLEANDN